MDAGDRGPHDGAGDGEGRVTRADWQGLLLVAFLFVMCGVIALVL
jgi:hypothetical protein